MYLLKTKGTAKIPDYIQLRDKNYSLLASIMIHNFEKDISKMTLSIGKEQLIQAIQSLEYGKVVEILPQEGSEENSPL